MLRNPRECYDDPFVLDLIGKLEQATSMQDYVRTFRRAHQLMVSEGVRTASISTISQLVRFEQNMVGDIKPESLVEKYLRVKLVDLSSLLSENTNDWNIDDLTTSERVDDSPSRRLSEIWSSLKHYQFMSIFGEYHFKMYREDFENTELEEVAGLIKFEKALGFPFDNNEIIRAYQQAHYGMTTMTVQGDLQLDEELLSEVQKNSAFFHRRTSPLNTALTIDVNWENYWQGNLQKGDLPLFWYVHAHDDSLHSSVYQGVVLVRDERVLYYDCAPMGGGPFEINEFKDQEFSKRARIIANNIERALKIKVN